VWPALGAPRRGRSRARGWRKETNAPFLFKIARASWTGFVYETQVKVRHTTLLPSNRQCFTGCIFDELHGARSSSFDQWTSREGGKIPASRLERTKQSASHRPERSFGSCSLLYSSLARPSRVADGQLGPVPIVCACLRETASDRQEKGAETRGEAAKRR
jgi:hypothetical protein